MSVWKPKLFWLSSSADTLIQSDGLNLLTDTWGQRKQHEVSIGFLVSLFVLPWSCSSLSVFTATSTESFNSSLKCYLHWIVHCIACLCVVCWLLFSLKWTALWWTVSLKLIWFYINILRHWGIENFTYSSSESHNGFNTYILGDGVLLPDPTVTFTVTWTSLHLSFSFPLFKFLPADKSVYPGHRKDMFVCVNRDWEASLKGFCYLSFHN